jgi:hypothetical protein
VSHRAEWTAFVEQQQREVRPIAVAVTKPLTAHGRQRIEKMNKTELAYEAHLNLRKIKGEIAWFAFEGMTFKLGPDVRYTPDFPVLLTDGTLECHEVKGTEKRVRKSGEIAKAPRFEDDARAKFQIAAALFPIVFKVVYRVEGNWIERTA